MKFELLGHDCPLGTYPSPVVPVGRLNGRLVTVYIQSGEKPFLSFLEKDMAFVRHSPAVTAQLKEFDLRKNRLFAFGVDDVVFYDVGKELKFFRSLLSNPSFAMRNPFLRLSLAKALKDPDIALREIRLCIKHLEEVTPNFVPTWYAGQIESFASSSEPRWINIPASWEEFVVSAEDRRSFVPKLPASKSVAPGKKIILIEDDEQVTRDITFCLQVRYPDAIIICVTEGEKSLELIKAEAPDLVMVDTSLPDVGVLELIGQIREFSNVPLIVLSERENDTEIALALEAGADMYTSKPFYPIQLLAGVRALLRRAYETGFETERAVSIGSELTINFATHEVFVSGERVSLTPTEYNLLSQLVRNEGKVLTHDILLKKVWGSEYMTDPGFVKKYIYRLRSKIEPDASKPQMIINKRGEGYRFARVA